MTEIYLDGWKGKDRVDIYALRNDYMVVEHRKSKETGDIAKIKHRIKRTDVVFVLDFLKGICKENRMYKYRELVGSFIHEKGWDSVCDRDSFNGGRNRAKYYFPYYYFPIKILEFYGRIKYFGRGGIRLL